MMIPRLIWVVLFVSHSISGLFACNETDVVVDVNNVVCNGEENGSIVVLTTFSSAALPYQYSINGGPFTGDSVFNNLTAGEYAISVKNSLGCIEDLPELFVVTQPEPLLATAVSRDAICGKDGQVYPVVSGGIPPYLYTWNTTPPTGLDTVRNLLSGNYQLMVKDQNNCQALASVTVDGPPVFEVKISPSNPLIDFGDEILFSVIINRPSGNFSYQWIPESGLSCSNCPEPKATLFTNQTFTVFVTDLDNGCKDSDTTQVVVEGTPNVFIPNAFTPNGDGQNDLLKIFGYGITTANIDVYNQKGFLVYQGTYDGAGWDGSINGEAAQEGLYFYNADVLFIDNTRQKQKGQVILIR